MGSTRDSGATISSMDMEKRSGIMEMRHMRVSFMMARKMAEEGSNGRTARSMKATL